LVGVLSIPIYSFTYLFSSIILKYLYILVRTQRLFFAEEVRMSLRSILRMTLRMRHVLAVPLRMSLRMSFCLYRGF
jgi:hypothetical protein